MQTLIQRAANNKIYLMMAIGGVLLSILAIMFFKSSSASKAVSEDIPLVRTSVVGSGGAAGSYTYAGEVRGRYESQLAFQVGGKIIKRNVETGSVVNPGDILMQIDPRDIQQSVNSGAAQVYSAESQLRLAATNLERFKRLYEQNAVSKAEYDRYQNSYDTAAAQLNQARAQYAQGANQLDYSALVADSAGIVASISAETGQVVAAGQSIVTLVRDGEREIEINVPENRVEEIRKASQIKITFWALPNVVINGKIREIAPMADKVSRTYKVRVSLINPPPDVKLGMTSSVVISSSSNQQSTLYIPLSAIYQTQDIPSVWVVDGGVAHLRPVKVGQYGDAKVQVLQGLNSGETIVTAGVHKLREGQKVRTTGGDAI